MRLLTFLLFIMSTAHAADLQWQANWILDRQWQSAETSLDWITDQNWSAQSEVELALLHNGFELAVQYSENQWLLSRLYQDIGTARSDWTVGIKPQEWAFAHSSDALNWLDDSPLILREQFLPIASLQNYCRLPDSAPVACGARLSGWLQQLDWQLMAERDNAWRLGSGLQLQAGTGGLFYVEGGMTEQKSSLSLAPLYDNGPLTTETTESTLWQGTLGLQWTTATNLTMHYEVTARTDSIQRSQWQTVVEQLETPAAGLVADVLDDPFPADQHMLRVQKQFSTLSAEQILILWPAADTWLSQSKLSYPLSPSLEASVLFEHHAAEGVLGKIGAGQRIELRVSLRDGLVL